MWIRISPDCETDEHEIINLSVVRYIRRNICDHNGTPTNVISFKLPDESIAYWPFTSSVRRDFEFERIHTSIKERDGYGKNS